MAQTDLESGQELLRSGRWADAVAAFRTAIADETAPEALHGLAEALWWTGDIQNSTAYYQRAYSAYREAGNSFGAAWAAIFLCIIYKNCLGNEAAANGWLARAETAAATGDPSPLQGWFDMMRGFLAAGHNLRLAAELQQRALDFAIASGDRDLELVTRADLGLTTARSGNLEAGLAMVDEAMAAISAGENSRLDTVVIVCCIMLTACEVTADFQRASQWSHVTDQFLASYGCPYLFAECRALYGSVLMANGHWEQAETELQSAIQSTSGIYPPIAALATGALADLRLRQGSLEDASTLLQGVDDEDHVTLPLASVYLAQGKHTVAIALLERTLRGRQGDSLEAVRALELLTGAHLDLGNVEQADAAVQRLTAAIGARPWAEGTARAAMAAGRVARARGDATSAVTCFETAAAEFARAGRPLERARARLAIADATKDLNPDLAAFEAREALDAFERLGAHPDMDGAAALLRDLGAPARSGPRNLGLLTERETEVLALLSHGLSNPEIAERLVISRKTAAHHVSNLLSKLGVRNRAEAIAYASRLTADSTPDA
jgi:ATP/maltotriose-dependent transcriptional regulator MalT